VLLLPVDMLGPMPEEFKERECQLLSELKEKDEFFQRKIAKKKKKIEKLKTELQGKEFELKSAQQKARLQQDKLLKAQAELRGKNKNVKQRYRGTFSTMHKTTNSGIMSV